MLAQNGDTLRAFYESFEALCDADLDEIADEMDDARELHLQKHKSAHGARLVIPKHHAGLHHGGQLRKDKYPWCRFVIERLNLRVRFLAEHVDKTSRFENSVLSSLLTKNYNDLMDGSLLRPGLRAKISPTGQPGEQRAPQVGVLGKD